MGKWGDWDSQAALETLEAAELALLDIIEAEELALVAAPVAADDAAEAALEADEVAFATAEETREEAAEAAPEAALEAADEACRGARGPAWTAPMAARAATERLPSILVCLMVKVFRWKEGCLNGLKKRDDRAVEIKSPPKIPFGTGRPRLRKVIADAGPS